MATSIRRYCCGLADALQSLPFALLEQAHSLLLGCHRRGGTVFILGNGGSAATASHFACDLGKGTRAGGPATFRVISLTDNVPLLTAWGNDCGYERVFAEQLVSLVRAEDLVLVISASGNSPNVVAAVEAAMEAGVTTIALTGRTGGRLRELADLTIRVPSDSIEQVEDAHMAIAHALCVSARAALKPATSGPSERLPAASPEWPRIRPRTPRSARQTAR